MSTRGIRRWLFPVVVVLVLLIVCFFFDRYRHAAVIQRQRQEQTRDKRAAPFTIGAVYPLTGPIASFGEYKRRGADLAADQINTHGGIGGHMLKIIYEDSQNSATVGITAFQKLVQTDKVPVVIAAMSQVCMALAPLADREKVVLFANVGHPEVTLNTSWVFRNFPTSDREADEMARFAKSKLGLKRAAILYLNDEWGNAGRDAFERSFRSVGGQIVASEAYTAGATDFRTQITKIKAASPDALYFTGYGNALGLICRQRVELALDARMLSTTGFNDTQVFKIAGEACEGVYFTSLSFDPQSAVGKQKAYVQMFHDKYNAEPEFDGALNYDTVMLVAQAIATNGYTAEGIRRWLSQVKNFDGICGNTTASGRDFHIPLVVRTIKQSRVVSPN